MTINPDGSSYVTYSGDSAAYQGVAGKEYFGYDMTAPAPNAVYDGTRTAGGTVNQVFWWVPDPVATTPTPQPAFSPAHLQFSAAAIGSPVFLAHGRCKLPGQVIWALGIDASHEFIESSFLTFASAYCEPIDPAESVRIQTMWANGTLFYDYDQGGLLQVASLDSVSQQFLQACIDNIEIHTGTETQQPSAVMTSYLGTGNVPAYRGLRYIVFSDFPLIVSNNSVPNIIVEWRPTSGGLLNVSDEMTLLIEHVNLRSESSPVFGTPTITDIDDLCYGLTITDQSSLIDHFTKHRVIYNLQVKEANPIEIVRRAVGSGLVIDVEVDESDLVIVSSGAPAFVTTRVNPTDFPIGMNLSYTDPDHNYDTKIAPAMFDGSQPGRASSTSSSVVSAQSDYVFDATTARSLAYNAMFNLRSYAGRAQLEMSDLRPEVGDTIAVTTREGDIYILLVETQTITKRRSNSIQAMQLLTAAGAQVNGDGGNDGGTLNRKYWPEDVLGPAFVVDASAGVDRVWSIRDVTSKYVIGMNSISAPRRKLSTLRWRDMPANDPAMIEWGADAAYFIQAGPMFQDDFYVYWMPGSSLIVTRLLKTADNIAGVQTLVFPEGFGLGSTNKNAVGYNNVHAFRDGKLYIAWNGQWNGVGSDTTNFKLVVVDVNAWDASAFTVHDYYVPGAEFPFPYAIEVTDNGTVVIATKLGSPIVAPFSGRYYYANISNLSSWSHVDATFPLVLFAVARSGDKVYFLESPTTAIVGVAARRTRVAVIDTSAGFTETIVDLNVKDANYLGHAQVGHDRMWCSETHLFVSGNLSDDFVTEQRYIGRFDLTSTSSPPTPLDAAGGKYLSEMIYNGFDFSVMTGKYFGGKVYMSLDCVNPNRLSFLQVDEDLTSPIHHWTNDCAAPVGDDFAARQLLVLNVAQTNNLTYGTTEANEPVPAWASPGDAVTAFNNGHSVWYEFIAPATQNYTITVTNPGFLGYSYGIVVYTGSSLASLTYVGGAAAPTLGLDNSAVISAVAGTSYKIAVRSHEGSDSIIGAAITARFGSAGNLRIIVTP